MVMDRFTDATAVVLGRLLGLRILGIGSAMCLICFLLVNVFPVLVCCVAVFHMSLKPIPAYTLYDRCLHMYINMTCHHFIPIQIEGLRTQVDTQRKAIEQVEELQQECLCGSARLRASRVEGWMSLDRARQKVLFFGGGWKVSLDLHLNSTTIWIYLGCVLIPDSSD